MHALLWQEMIYHENAECHVMQRARVSPRLGGDTLLVTVKTEKNVELEKYYMLRGIKKKVDGNTVIAEKEFDDKPSSAEIAQFILESGCDFTSLVENFRVTENDFPFT